jgi:4-diphosphocytidyl-2-C-methyl-D-erythritol kinase
MARGLNGGLQSVIAPAKVNLTLAVLGKRSDGYHDIASVAAKITLYDGLDLETGVGPAIRIECSDPAVPTDGRNLVWRAAESLPVGARQREPLRIRLFKRIPVGAGLGGGSSDAAAALLALTRRWGVALPELMSVAARLGSDVPLFLHPGAVSARGRGEAVEPAALPWRGWLVLVIPPFGVSTAEVYKHWSAGSIRHSADDAMVCLGADYASASTLREVLFNDLEESVFAVQPRLREVKARVEAIGGCKFHLTGSGSALFSCLDVHEQAVQLQQAIGQEGGLRSQITRVLTCNDHE